VGSMMGSGPLLVVLGIAMVDSSCACTSLRDAAAAVMMFFSAGGEDKDSTFFVLMQYFILV